MEKTRFIKDIPFPESNLAIYKDIYYVEQWLRRILFAALFFIHGEEWVKAIPDEVLSSLKQRRGSLKGRTLYDSENDSNILWLTTLHELNQLITSETLWPIVRRYSKFTRVELNDKINALREIRNIIGHNRAATQLTSTILKGITEAINEGIKCFKNEMKKDMEQTDEHDVAYWRGEDNHFSQLSKAIFDYYKTTHGPSAQFLSGTEYYYEYTHLPMHGMGSWVNIAQLLEAFRDLENCVLAFNINMCCEELSITWPKNIEVEHHFQMIDRTRILAEKYVWTEVEYARQSPKYLCHPKVWFYNDQSDF